MVVKAECKQVYLICRGASNHREMKFLNGMKDKHTTHPKSLSC